MVKQQSCVLGILCLIWSYHPPPGWGLQFCRRTQKTLLCIFLWVGTRTCLKAVPPFDCFPSVFVFLPFSDYQLFESTPWNSGILPIQCLFSKLSQSYAPFWQKVITVIVALFSKLRLSRTLWGGNSGVQTCCTVKYRLYSACLTFPEFQVLVWLKSQSLGLPFCCNIPS